MQVDNLAERFRKIGVAGFTPKVTRSTFRTGMQRLGCPKEVREKMTHHQERDQVAKSYDKYDFALECKTLVAAVGYAFVQLGKEKPYDTHFKEERIKQ